MSSVAAAHYSVVTKLFATLSLFVTVIGLVLWPSNSQALARGDINWVRTTTRRAAALSGVIVLATGVPMVLLCKPLLTAWLGKANVPAAPMPLLMALLAWSAILAMASPLFMVQNSIGLLRPQLLGWCAFLPISIIFKVILVQKIGIAGVPIAGSIAYVALMVPPAIFGYRRSLATTAANLKQGLPTQPGRH